MKLSEIRWESYHTQSDPYPRYADLHQRNGNVITVWEKAGRNLYYIVRAIDGECADVWSDVDACTAQCVLYALLGQ